MCLFQLCKSNKPNKSLPILLCKITHAQSHRMESISKQQVSSVAATSQLTGLSQLLDFDWIMNIFCFNLPSIFLSTLTSLPAAAEETHFQSMMLPPPCLGDGKFIVF
ncbi:hypothetical protein ATANTOWER_001175 [Ataeniobius toweri]|uniref:Uncharacterized protein n=1 Tax=Ataeniobius toweri TaxID=208326 RepID=A0ABU7AX28_9TELE|nr:hypothetical protein [Ataeniobius toweri]